MLRGYFALVSYFQIKTGEFTRTTLSVMRGGLIVTFSSPGGNAVEDVDKKVFIFLVRIPGIV